MKKVIKVVVVLGMSVVSSCFGSPYIIASEEWAGSLPTDTAGWKADQTIESGADVVNFNHTLQLTIPGTSMFPISGVYADAGSSGGNFVGDYYGLANTLHSASSNLVVKFTLTTLNNYNSEADSMWMYFVSRNGHQYFYNQSLSQPAINTPTPYHFVISSQDNWLWNPNLGWDFVNDYGDVTAFGLGFSSTLAGGDHIIQLSGFELAQELVVPEPETIWMMVVVLASLGLTFRSRLTDIGAQVKARFVA